MSYESEFKDDTGWSAIDTNVKLTGERGRKFQEFLKQQNVSTIIRYYASTKRAKTLSLQEAKLISSAGFQIIPVYQDRNRRPEDFGTEKGKECAANAAEFAAYIGQPEGSTIFFAADEDFSQAEIDKYIVPYFEEIASRLGGAFRIGAYGSGLVLSALLDRELIEVPWISMSRAFRGTREFFYGEKWALRQVPPAHKHGTGASQVGYDRNVLSWSAEELGAFRLDEAGSGVVVGEDVEDAVLGGGFVSLPPAPKFEIANAYVSTEGLNLRTEPDGTIIRALTIGQPVQDLGAADDAKWRRVEVEGQQGVVFAKYLRKPGVPEVEALLGNTIEQWVRFDKGRAHEATSPYYKFIGEMWASIGESYDGRSRYADGTEVPWSAAFISYVVRKSGSAYAGFKFAPSHSVFSHDAIQARLMNRTDRPFWGFRLRDHRPEIGDIIHRNRGSGKFSFDYAENHARFSSHSDIVVEVTPHVVRVIGGNVGDTVSMRDSIQEYDLDGDGFLKDGQRVIALLKNRASEVTAIV
jgi:glycoside hydrolase-like protein/uncharacterized protein DUF2272